jgi:hypothetical protein
MDGTNYSFPDISSQIQSGTVYPGGGNFVATYSAWTRVTAFPSTRTLNSTNATVVYPPNTATLLPPGWTDPSGWGFSQKGVVYSGGGQTRATYNAMAGTVTYNILKDGAPFATGVTMPYTLTHTGPNGNSANYIIRAVGSAGGTSDTTWTCFPYPATGGAYVSATSAPSMGDQQGTMNFVNNNLPSGGTYYLVTVYGRLLGNCVYCGSGCYLTSLSSASASNTSGATIYLNTYYYRGYSSSEAYFDDIWYLFTDVFDNGPLLSPTFYGSFGYYNLQSDC